MAQKLKIVICSILALSIIFSSASVCAADTPETPSAETEEVQLTEQVSTEPATEPTTEKVDAEKPFTGWKETKSGKKKYYKKGKKYIGLHKIGKNKYYFNKKGYMVTGKSVKDGKKTYYLAESGKLRAYKKGKTYYKKNGKKMNKAETQDWKTRLTAEKLVKKITKKDMTKKQKLRACFDWVMAKPYVTYRHFRATSYWPATYANDHFKRRGGDCHADAAAFAYLAVALGYKNVYVCNDSNGSRAQGHAWTEINGKVYDPLFAQAKGFKKHYGVTYKTYVLRPILHINVDYNKNRPKK